MTKFPRFLHEPDGGASGDPEGDSNGTGTGEPAPSSSQSDLKAVADSIKSAILEARAGNVPPAFVAPAAPVGPSMDSIRQALDAEGLAVNAKVNELSNAGDVAGALAIRDAFINKANRALSAPVDDNAMVKTAVALGERVARAEHKTIMDRWGDEVRRAVNALPLEERVLPNAWDKAVAQTRTNHFQELVDETVNARVEEARKSFIPPPVAPGSRGARRLEGPAAKLDEVQLWAADLCGVEPADYAKELAREERFDALPFKERGPFPGYPILEGTVTPGSF